MQMNKKQSELATEVAHQTKNLSDESSSVHQSRTSHDKQESEISVYRQSAVKEESSDESTIISSQTSTLTRNQGIVC